jgi:hypothetical protein
VSVVRIPRADAEYALKVALAAVSKDDVTPVLTAVHWRVEDGKLTLTATDRYRVHQATVSGLDDADDGEFLMQASQAKWLTTQKHLPVRIFTDQFVEVEWFEIEGAPMVTARVVAADFGGAPAFSYTVEGIKGNFPPVGRLFPEEQDADAPRAPFVGLNPVFLAALKVMQRYPNEALKVWSPLASDKQKLAPIVIEASGGDARAMIQPNILLH